MPFADATPGALPEQTLHSQHEGAPHQSKPLAEQFRRRIGASRVRALVLCIGRAGRAVEDEIGAVVHERRAMTAPRRARLLTANALACSASTGRSSARSTAVNAAALRINCGRTRDISAPTFTASAMSSVACVKPTTSWRALNW